MPSRTDQSLIPLSVIGGSAKEADALILQQVGEQALGAIDDNGFSVGDHENIVRELSNWS